jgi:hypothetical protein
MIEPYLLQQEILDRSDPEASSEVRVFRRGDRETEGAALKRRGMDAIRPKSFSID